MTTYPHSADDPSRAGTNHRKGMSPIERLRRQVEKTRAVKHTMRTSTEWVGHFRHNRTRLLELPWERGAEMTADERDAIARSVREFQLGESSEGKHLIRQAATFALRTGDTDYVEAAGLFIAEEQRHARDLGRFMDLAGIERATKAWPDVIFRWLRHRAGLELSIAVLVTAEIVADVYYPALREATGSPLLRRLCDQILSDEAAHINFQSERLAMLRRKRSKRALRWIARLHRGFLWAACVVVWMHHGRAMRAGGHDWRHFKDGCLKTLDRAAGQMDPRGYAPDAASGISSRIS